MMIAATKNNQSNHAGNSQTNRANQCIRKKLVYDYPDYPYDDELRSCLKSSDRSDSPFPRRVNRKVCIDRTRQFFFIDTKYSDNEWQSSFWSNEEFEHTIEKCKKEANKLSMNVNLDESVESSRGIERFTEKGNDLRMMQVRNAKWVVEAGKDLWYLYSTNNEVAEALADTYSHYCCTKATANVARHRGMADERDAWKIYTEDSFEWNSMQTLSTAFASGRVPRRMSL